MLERLILITNKPKYRAIKPPQELFTSLEALLHQSIIPAAQESFKNIKPRNIESGIASLVGKFKNISVSGIDIDPEVANSYVDHLKRSPVAARFLVEFYNNCICIPEEMNVKIRGDEFYNMAQIYDACARRFETTSAAVHAIFSRNAERIEDWNKQLFGMSSVFFANIEGVDGEIDNLRSSNTIMASAISSGYEKTIRYIADLIAISCSQKTSMRLSDNINKISNFCIENGIDASGLRMNEMRIYKNAASHGGFEIDYESKKAHIFNTRNDGEIEGFHKTAAQLIGDINWVINLLTQEHEIHKEIHRIFLASKPFKKQWLRNIMEVDQPFNIKQG